TLTGGTTVLATRTIVPPEATLTGSPTVTAATEATLAGTTTGVTTAEATLTGGTTEVATTRIAIAAPEATLTG
ncbi:hypothetical protein ACK8GD_22155, partial [Micromonosporaceae bacterium DT32]